MSKNKHKLGHVSPAISATAADAGEYRVIFTDLLRVLVVNAVFLVLVLWLYYENQQTGLLDNLAAKIFRW